MKLSTSFFAFLALCLFVPLLGFGQATGDYQTVATGINNWTDATKWARWNGVTWISNPPQGYPGQNSGTGKVSIISGKYLISDVIPEPIAELEITSTASNAALRFEDNNLTNSLKVSGNITIAANKLFGLFDDDDFLNSVHELYCGGDIINNGTLIFNTTTDVCTVTFNGSTNQTISGSGATTRFNLITINNTGSSGNNIVEVNSSNFSTATSFLTLTQGILKLSGSYSFSELFFPISTYTIPAGTGIWLNNPNVSVPPQNGAITLNGLIRITNGTYTIGNSANADLTYGDGAELIIEGGTLDIYGFFHGVTTTNNISFTMSGGVMTIGIKPASANNTYSVFDMRNTGSTFNMSGGSIVLENANNGASNAYGYRNASSTYSVTGGTLQFGNSATVGGQKDDFVIADGTVCPSIAIVDNGTSVPTLSLLTTTNVYGNITINNGTTFLGNGQSINLSGNSATNNGNWTNDGVFTPGTGSVIFNSTYGVQTVGGTASTNFYNAEINGDGISLAINTTIDNLLTLTSNHATLNNFDLTLANSTGLSGGSSSSYIKTNGTGRFNRTITGAATYFFPIGSTTAYHPGTVTWTGAPGVTQVSGYFNSSVLSNPSALYSNAYGGGESTLVDEFLDNGYWDFTATGTPNVFDLELVANAITNMGANDSFHSIFQNSTTGPTGWADAGTVHTISAFSSSSITLQSGSVSGFGIFGIGKSDEYILPIVLVVFDGQNIGNANVLNWTTATELNNDYFTIERSLDGKNYEVIGTVQGAGQSSTLLDYEYTDAQPFLGTNYYRLKQTDYNGDFDYSNVISIKVNSTFEMGYPYPNPVVNNVSMNVMSENSGITYLRIFDMTGREMYAEKIAVNAGIQTLAIDMTNFASGMYISEIEIDGVAYRNTILKQ